METHDQRVYDSNPLGLKYYHNEDDFQEEDTGDSGNPEAKDPHALVLIWEFPVPYFWGPYNKDPTI